MAMTFFNRGLYSYPEVAALSRLSIAQVRALVYGYKGSSVIPPLKDRKILKHENRDYLSFFDLIEIRFISHFISKGISRSRVFKIYKNAKRELKREHPFATRFTTDGLDIFADNLNRLLSMEDEQYAFRETVEAILDDGILFDDNNDACAWWPYSKELPKIMLNPSYRYGKPVVEGYNILTKTLYEACKVEEDNYKRVGEWYEVPEILVKQAVDFEKRLAA